MTPEQRAEALRLADWVGNKQVENFLRAIAAEHDALRAALNTIAEHTGSDDPCASYVQIARIALRATTAIRKGTT